MVFNDEKIQNPLEFLRRVIFTILRPYSHKGAKNVITFSISENRDYATLDYPDCSIHPY
jgi:hypothetical protein